MSDELIYQSSFTGSQIDGAIEKVPIIEATLEQKADIHELTNGQDLNTCINKRYYRAVLTSIVASLLNKPSDINGGEVFVEYKPMHSGNGYGEQILTSKIGTNVRNYIRCNDNGIWSAWKIVATTDKIDILLLNGWTIDEQGTAKAYKNGSHISMNFNIIGGISSIIFNLPIGFRPNHYIRVATDVTINNVMLVETIQISPNGDVQYTSPHDFSQRHFIDIQFDI